MKFDEFLSLITKEAAKYLRAVLPELFEDWWKEGVIDSLSFQQRKIAEINNCTSLSQLDLASLLRIFDYNWYKIKEIEKMPSEYRHYLKEMQSIRNRWAHQTAENYSNDDTYRDLDTMQRFIIMINPKSSLVENINDEKKSIIAGMMPEGDTAKVTDNRFSMGQIVCLKSNPDTFGAVVGITPGEHEERIKVLINGDINTYYSSQLTEKKQNGQEFVFINYEEFNANLTALQIRYPALSTLYSLNSARIDFIPYQFRPVLRFIRSDRPKLLIADGVGIGKTIEAGLILRELQARREIKSILIICPRPLVTEKKWQMEMKRFDEHFVHLDGKSLRYAINETHLDGMWPDEYSRAILPYSLCDESLLYGTEGRRKKKYKGLIDLDPPPCFDLVIVDEAHHVRNPATYSHKVVSFFCDHAEAVLFLTATPIQMGTNDLFVLLNMLRPDLIIDQESFSHMAEPNPFINRAVLDARNREDEWEKKTYEDLMEALATPWGQSILKNSPSFKKITEELSKPDISDEDRVKIINDIESLYTFSGIINRTRRRDIEDFTVRKPSSVYIPFTPEQEKLHNDILRIQAEILSFIHNNLNIKFMMTTIRRQAASCLHGLVPLLNDILNRHIDELEWDEADSAMPAPDITAIDDIKEQITIILQIAESLPKDDPKLDALIEIIADKQKLDNKKLMIFSSFRHTLHYLHDRLSELKIPVGMIHGGTPEEDRVYLRDRFESTSAEDRCLDVLLFSEVGCEGLDYQFCDCIVNYDLPWNPMRIEQRIGRIDRRGQKSESVLIYNMITPGTVDADIYDRCLTRIGIFNSAIGASEEILGEITKEIKDIAEDYKLSDEEIRSKLQQLSDNKIRLIHEQEELEKHQSELFGLSIPENRIMDEIEQSKSFWLSPEALKNLIDLYLKHRCSKDQDYILGEKPVKTLRLSQEARNILLEDLKRLERQRNVMFREWENWLKSTEPHLPVTFSSEAAKNNPKVSFIIPTHPLVRQAALAFGLSDNISASLIATSNKVSPGIYEFAIYKWQYHGFNKGLVLTPVSASESLTNNIKELLEIARDHKNPDYDMENFANKCNQLDKIHYEIWKKEKEAHQQRTKELAEYRRESLNTSHKARIALLEEQLKQAEDEKIQRMRQSQIRSANNDYIKHLQEIDIAIERADLTAEPVAYGIIRVIR